jgi:hypothetical protein
MDDIKKTVDNYIYKFMLENKLSFNTYFCVEAGQVAVLYIDTDYNIHNYYNPNTLYSDGYAAVMFLLLLSGRARLLNQKNHTDD